MSNFTSAIAQQLPPDFVTRLHVLYPDRAEAILQSFAAPKLTTFRANTLKTTVDQLAFDLKQAGFTTHMVPGVSLAFVLDSPTQRALTEHELYYKGHLYVQGLSSMVPPLLLAPQAGESVLDVAAAPGSKTTQMAAMMRNQGTIIANDTSSIRLLKLKSNLETQGVTCVNVFRGEGQDLADRFGEVFDKVLVDVPCSMEGRFRLDKPKTLKTWSVRAIKELSWRQKMLLKSAIGAAEGGATIVYSTCTLAPEENEGVIDWMLHTFPDQVELLPIELPGVPFEPAVLEWEGSRFDARVSMTARIIPSAEWEGFFVAKIKKLR
jgi:16S rRNA (cytosine1407-C5)-methyltransferase